MTADTVGGVWHYALELARGLDERGIDVTLATLGRCLDAEQRRAARAIPHLTIYESAYRLEWMRDPWIDLDRAGDWLLGIAEVTRPDVVHLNHYCHGALDWPAPVLIVAHSCVYSWHDAVHGTPPGAEWERYWQAVAHGLAGADLVVAPTAAMLAAADKHYGPLAATRVIANGRRRTAFLPGVKQPRILAAGRLWDEGKNLGALARVAPCLDWPLRLAGEPRGPDGQRGEFANVEQCGPLSSVRLTREYASASIYAVPARYEPFGLGILEAALAGCALVLGDIPSLREVWGPAPLYVPPDDDARLIATLSGLTRDTAACRMRALRARRRAFLYGAARMTTAYVDAYRDLMQSARTVRAPIYRGIRDRCG